jgi:hypothetical protein
MNPEMAWNGSDFLDWPEAQMRGVDGSAIPDCPNGVRRSHLAIFAYPGPSEAAMMNPTSALGGMRDTAGFSLPASPLTIDRGMINTTSI